MVAVQACLALVGVCCPPDSNLCKHAAARGLKTLRITEECRFDHANGLKLARDFLQANTGADAWLSLPCTAWCTWQYVNEAKLGPAYCARLG